MKELLRYPVFLRMVIPLGFFFEFALFPATGKLTSWLKMTMIVSCSNGRISSDEKAESLIALRSQELPWLNACTS